MKLTKVQVTNFRSIEDTGEFAIGDVTCLVGKNESGKTTVLQAIERLNPVDTERKVYNKLQDYPRRHWSEYDERHSDGEATVIVAKWLLDDNDVAAVEALLGPGCLKSKEVTTEKSYEQTSKNWTVPLDEAKVAENLWQAAGGGATEHPYSRVSDLLAYLDGLTERTPAQDDVLRRIKAFRDHRPLLAAIDVLAERCPEFLYFANYSRMAGDVAIDALNAKRAGRNPAEPLSEGELLFEQFLEYAGTSLKELQEAKKYEELTARLESASNKITDRVFDYWSQNQYLAIRVAVDQARPEDPAPFNSGTIVRARVYNDLHKVTVPFNERSAGFVWFFSFLVAFAQVKKKHGNVIILLDEPGHGLHGKAQADLLRFIDEKLRPNHQVIYSTHSPFMVPADKLESVRIVEDKVEGVGTFRPKVLGTKVSEQFLSSDADAVFPLQAALGYEITQTLFVGKDTLLVEGPSDILYLQAASEALKKRGNAGLSDRWTICPSGGVDKVWPFVSLFAGKHLHVAVLTDVAQGTKKNIDRLRNSSLLAASNVMTVAEFVSKPESDIEDFFEEPVWADIVNGTYGLKGADALKAKALTPEGAPVRILAPTEEHFRLRPSLPEFSHFTPSAWLIRNPALLEKKDEAVERSLDRFQALFDRLNALLR
ncbi:ATP-dependent endonuclease [Microvirga sp. 17 mud 1-3]|uniref:ATP-dependent nuclease n=1 Tax=Microvirga sp. 17 mud 1-3 TaxID=2082949 RepID=UPI000D6A871E|nr:AAA family ATPase [Microvirga sp. 17 mud 1-3]AWM87085.1 ATP-dependent endonuclease [Microvirga sp. 17 mud 1-3]